MPHGGQGAQCKVAEDGHGVQDGQSAGGGGAFLPSSLGLNHLLPPIVQTATAARKI